MNLNRKHILKIGLSALLLIAIQGCASHANYPVTRLADWTPEKINWKVTELSAKFEHQKFNYSNKKGYIVINAKINVLKNEDWVYKIRRVHISQRIIKEDIAIISSIEVRPFGGELSDNQRYIEKHMKVDNTGKIPFTLIEITPVITQYHDKDDQLKPTKFELLINEPIINRKRGRIYYRVKIGDKHVDLGTFQGK